MMCIMCIYYVFTQNIFLDVPAYTMYMHNMFIVHRKHRLCHVYIKYIHGIFQRRPSTLTSWHSGSVAAVTVTVTGSHSTVTV